MENYIFDLKIASLMLGVDENSPEALDFIKQYKDKVTELIKNFTTNYFKSKGWTDEKIVEELNKLQTQHIENSEFLEDFEFLESLGKVQNEYNKKIYDLYRPKLTQSQKDAINNYIQSLQMEMNKATQQA